MSKYVIDDTTLSGIADAIRAKTGKTDSMTPEQMPAEISGITGGKEEQVKTVTITENGSVTVMPDEGKALSSVEITVAVEGGSSADVRYVTFMNGDTVLYVKPVAVGDDCVDVLTKGLIETPTKESTAQYNYTYYGWGASDNGAADSTILQNITEDKTVYAIYTATVRYYTITWLDDDGVTVLHTEQVAYGTVPSYIPEKSGASFSAWNPSPVAVTGDATYTATWLEKVTFANSSWADIASVCEAGQAQETFALGDERVITYDGREITFYIAGFGHDELYADSAVKTGITVLSKTPIGDTTKCTTQYGTLSFSETTTFGKLPSDLQSVLKRVRKHEDSKSSTSSTTVTEIDVNRRIFVPSIQEMGKTRPTGTRELGTTYAKVIIPTGIYWWFRNMNSSNSNGIKQCVYDSGSVTSHYQNREYDTIIGFCI